MNELGKDSPWVPKVRRDSISWWAEVYRDGRREASTSCLTGWGARWGARRLVRRMEKLERTGWLANPTRDV